MQQYGVVFTGNKDKVLLDGNITSTNSSPLIRVEKDVRIKLVDPKTYTTTSPITIVVDSGDSYLAADRVVVVNSKGVDASLFNIYNVDADLWTVVSYNNDKKLVAPTAVPVSITSAGWTTLYTIHAYTMPEGLEGYTVSAVDNGAGTLTLTNTYAAGTVVPASTPLLIKGAAGEYTAEITTGGTAAGTNLLTGSLYDATTTGASGDLFYKLSLSDSDDNLGFYWGAADGAAFTSKGNKAYLALGGTSAKGYAIIVNGDATGINAVDSAERNTTNTIYTINGVRVKNMDAPGIYIVNGKKVAVK